MNDIHPRDIPADFMPDVRPSIRWDAYRRAVAAMRPPADTEAAQEQAAWDAALTTKDNGNHRRLTIATANGTEIVP